MLVGYARVSTRDQSPALQLEALRGTGRGRVFEETASGAQRERSALAAALDYMREGDTLVVWKLDRLARSVRQLVETMEDLETRGAGFRSITEAIETTTPGGRLIFHIFGALTEFDRSIIREHTIAGLLAARSQGRQGGRPPRLSEQDLVEARALLRDASIPVTAVVRRLGVAPSTLYRYLPAARAGSSPG